MRKRKLNGLKLFWMVPQKSGEEIGKNKVGKGTKVMMVSDGNGVPIGLYLDSAHIKSAGVSHPENSSGTAKAGTPPNATQGIGG